MKCTVFLIIVVSVPHFVILSITSIVYAIERKSFFGHYNFHNRSRFVGTVLDKNIQSWHSCVRNNLRNSYVMDHVLRHQNLPHQVNCLISVRVQILELRVHQLTYIRKKHCYFLTSECLRIRSIKQDAFHVVGTISQMRISWFG